MKQKVCFWLPRSSDDLLIQGGTRRGIKKTKKVCFIIVSTDKGLCGGLNINLFKSVIAKAAELNKNEIDASFAIIGSKAAGFFKSVGGEIVAKTEKLGDKPNPEDLIGLTKIVLDLHKNNEVDEVYLCSNKLLKQILQMPCLK